MLIEINSTDGDIGFHFLMDGDDLNSARIHDPNGVKVFEDKAKGPLREQKLTETFAESAEPLCWEDPDEMDDWEDIVTLDEFLERWTAGTYVFSGKGDDGEKLTGETELTFNLPAAPMNLDFDGSVISWAAGVDLGNCSEGSGASADGDFTLVTPAAWEVVFEPDVADGNPTGQLKFTVRVPLSQTSVAVPQEYLDSLPDDTPAKFEVGAIGADDNATFTEMDGICVNVDGGC